MKKSIIISALVLIMATLIIWNIRHSGVGKEEKKKPIPLVGAGKAEQRYIAEIIELTGEVAATRRVTIKTTVTGMVSYCPWREGDTVKAGADMIRIERPLLIAEMEAKKAALEVAKAKLADIEAGARPEEIVKAQHEVSRLREHEAYTKSDLERNEKLFEKNIVSRENFELAKVDHAKSVSDLQSALETLKMLEEGATKTQIAVLEAQVKEAAAQYGILREKVAECEIKAPFTGIITKMFVREGDLVREGREDVIILEMLDPESIVMRFQVPERYASSMRKGGDVFFSIDSLGGDYLESRIARVYPEIDESTHTVTVEADLDTPAASPGMFARIRLPVDSAADAVVVPDTALLTDLNGKPYVFILDDGKAVKRLVEKGIESGSSVQIKKGISPGEMVITAGNDSLKDGSPVRVQKKAPPESPGQSGNLRK